MNQMMPEAQPQMQPIQPQGQTQTTNGFGMSPQQAPPQEYKPQPDEISNGHKALDAVMDGLIRLVSKPPGELTKKSVFDETSDMIAHGAFPTQEAKQGLIGELASLPDSEDGIRKVLGQHLMTLAGFRNHYHNAFGPPGPDAPLAPEGLQ